MSALFSTQEERFSLNHHFQVVETGYADILSALFKLWKSGFPLFPRHFK
jgi:hypothetical protein